MSNDDIISGQVVQADDDAAADEDQAPETYFHKVAGPQRSYSYPFNDAADERPAAADPASTDPDLPAVEEPVAVDEPVVVDELDDDEEDNADEAVVVNEPVMADELDNDEADEVEEPVVVDEAVVAEEPAVADEAVVVDEMGDDEAEEVAAAELAETTQPAVTPVTATATSVAPEGLLGDTSALMQQWRQATAQFVDDPRASASQAADVVAAAVTTLETALRERRAAWDGGRNGQSDTEALRQAVLGYRHILDKLLS